MDRTVLWQRLHRERLVPTETFPALQPSAHTPWYTRAMLGFAGWLAGMFLVAFVGGSFAALFRDGPALSVLGLAFCAAAVAIDRRAGRQDVVSQMALAIAIAGQAFVAFGLAQALTGESWRQVAAALVVLYAVLFVLGSTFVFRLVSAVFGAGALLVAVHDTPGAPVAGALMALSFAAQWGDAARWRAAPDGWGRRLFSDGVAAWAFALVLAGWTVPVHVQEALRPDTPRYLHTLANALGLAWLAWRLTAARPRARAFALAGVAALAAACHGVPGVVAGVLVLVAGFAASQRGLMALGTVAILGYLSAYYYQLHQTLLEKAMWLAITAAALLAALALVKAAFGREESA